MTSLCILEEKVSIIEVRRSYRSYYARECEAWHYKHGGDHVEQIVEIIPDVYT